MASSAAFGTRRIFLGVDGERLEGAWALAYLRLGGGC